MLAWQWRGFLFVCLLFFVCCLFCLFTWLLFFSCFLLFFPQNYWALFYDVSVPASSSAFLEFTESMAACIRIYRRQQLFLYSRRIPLAGNGWMQPIQMAMEVIWSKPSFVTTEDNTLTRPFPKGFYHKQPFSLQNKCLLFVVRKRERERERELSLIHISEPTRPP